MNIKATSKLLCPIKLNRPEGFDDGKAVCIVENQANANVLDNLNRRVQTLLSHMT